MANRASTFPARILPKETTHTAGDVIKRIFDFFCAALGLLILSPLFVYIAWRIRRDSPGPVFFRGQRMGRFGRPFGILKFRTMREDPESYAGPKVTAQDDPRVTPFGRWLRDTKINELPQLWNVLVGEMSLVGPRPEDPDLTLQWPPEAREEILSVRPGITSPASVQFRNEEELLQVHGVMHTYMEHIVPTKLRLDQLYVRHRSFWLDLDTLLWTGLLLLPQIRAYTPGEEKLFAGPVSRFFGRYLNWFTIDAIVSFFAMVLAGLLWRSSAPLDIGWPKALAVAFVFAVLFSLTGSLWGIQRVAWSKATAEDLLDLAPPTALATLLALVVNTLFLNLENGRHLPILPPGMILTAALLAYAGFVTVRYRTRLYTGLSSRWLAYRRGGLQAARERALIVGGGESGQIAAWLLARRKGSNAIRVVGFVDDDLFKQGVRITGLDVLGTRTDIPHLVAANDIGVIIFAIHNIDPAERQEILDICTSTPARIVMVPDIISRLTSAVEGPSASHEQIETLDY